MPNVANKGLSIEHFSALFSLCKMMLQALQQRDIWRRLNAHDMFLQGIHFHRLTAASFNPFLLPARFQGV